MSATIKTIKSHLTDDTIYPITKSNAVYMAGSTTDTVDDHLTGLETLVGSSSISNINSTITGAIGNNALTTTAQTLSGAVNELNNKLILTNWTQLISGVEYASEGNHVFIRFNIGASLSTTFTTIATLPTGKRPSFNQYFRVVGSNGVGDVTVLVTSDGSIQARVDSGTGTAINGFICIA